MFHIGVIGSVSISVIGLVSRVLCWLWFQYFWFEHRLGFEGRVRAPVDFWLELSVGILFGMSSLLESDVFGVVPVGTRWFFAGSSSRRSRSELSLCRLCCGFLPVMVASLGHWLGVVCVRLMLLSLF